MELDMAFTYIKWIKSHFFYATIGVFGISFTQPIFADAAEVQFGGGLMYFDYAEYDIDNKFLDGETGLIPGVIFKRKKYAQKIFTELVAQLYGNRIQYDGHTQPGNIPLQTKSIAVIFDGHFKLGKRLADKHEAYLGLGYRYWYRHIQNGHDVNGQPVSGLLEHYKWFYWLLGYSADYRASDTVSVGYDFRYTKMFNATMDIDFLGFRNEANRYDDKTVNLGNRDGAKISIPIKIKTRNNNFVVAPYYEIIDIGRSNSVVATQNGGVPVPGTDCNGAASDTCVLTEPRSETRNVGIEFTWLW